MEVIWFFYDQGILSVSVLSIISLISHDVISCMQWQRNGWWKEKWVLRWVEEFGGIWGKVNYFNLYKEMQVNIQSHLTLVPVFIPHRVRCYPLLNKIQRLNPNFGPVVSFQFHDQSIFILKSVSWLKLKYFQNNYIILTPLLVS